MKTVRINKTKANPGRLLRWVFAMSAVALATSTGALPDVKGGLPTHKVEADDFFYAQQTSLWVFFKAPKEAIRRQLGTLLDTLNLEVASFEDKDVGYLVVKPMVFMAEFGSQTATIPGTSASTEVEMTLLVYPKNQPAQTSQTFNEFLKGQGTGSSVGQLRLDVLCDHEIAVSAGRKNFGEHKFLGSFEYSYPTPNNQVGSSDPFHLTMAAYTYKGAGVKSRKMFEIKADLKGLVPVRSPFSPELLFSSFPPEPKSGELNKTVAEFRHYDNKHFLAFLPTGQNHVELSFGAAKGAVPLKPAAPFGDEKPILGSEMWPKEMVEKMRAMLSGENAVGFLLYKSPSAEYESKPFEIKN